MRISAVLNIYRSLFDRFPVKEEALIWMTGRHHAPVFDGRSPLVVMLEDGDRGLEVVARYLHSWR
ncbi:antitoxin Xre/MbcA/ParS toxin-binding domain-containing protein [Thalassospira tepidiphila]|uniref:antitoxin Xre/MbcA/ParS toxin-binding domain-containing protein n=1 Tax=Thalassospira tepidiphila TaxID=393657 RepID=UPI003CC8276E